VTATGTPGAAYVARFASLVKIEHTIFALPFAYVGVLLALGEIPSAADLLWVTLAMAGARSLAMALNRLVDAEIDARNPRTAGRELPSGLLSRAQVVVFCVLSLAVFLLAVWQLDPLVRWLWPIPVLGFVIYPYLKRFTWLGHLWLGAVDGLAPVGGWVAVTGELPWEAWALGAAVALWVAGFDLFYALLDVEVDRAQGLHSWPVRWGERATFTAARAFHAATVALLAVVGVGVEAGVAYWLGVAAVAGLLVYEHRLVRPGDLRRLDAAFFTVNGVMSVVFCLFVLLDVVA
jgi:4-hydroxybenzoate polyprenyltransferase